MKIFNKLLVIFIPLLIASCSSAANNVTPTTSINVEQLYNQGIEKIKAGYYSQAINNFEELERLHPYSQWATRGKVMAVFANFKMGDYEQTVMLAESFIRLHPGHKSLAYLYYLRALSFYHQISDVNRDQGNTKRALEAFKEITYRFPESKYSSDAKLKITLCEAHLAGQELMVGRFYQQQGQLFAAINRFKTAIRMYEKSNQTPEALFRITETYLALGIEEEAQKAAAVLGHNFPKSEWYQKAYNLLTKSDLQPQQTAQTSGWLTNFVNGIKAIAD